MSIKEVMAEIASDCESDARGLNGQKFNGRVVATQLGNQLAMIQRIALAVAELDSRVDGVSQSIK